METDISEGRNGARRVGRLQRRRDREARPPEARDGGTPGATFLDEEPELQREEAKLEWAFSPEMQIGNRQDASGPRRDPKRRTDSVSSRPGMSHNPFLSSTISGEGSARGRELRSGRHEKCGFQIRTWPRVALLLPICTAY